MADIELIIKMNKEQYEFIKQGMTMSKVKDYYALLYDICEHIKNGTPLPKQDKFDNQAKWLLNGLKVQIYALADEKGNQLDLEDVIKIIDAYKEQEDNGFFDEIMDDESEDEETYEKIKEIIAKVKEQEE